MIVWDKGPMGLGWHYRRSYETVLVAQKRGGPCKWHDNSAKIENIIRPGQLEVNKIIPTINNHPTEKPEGLVKFFLNLHSQKGDVILDPFCGSGTTLRAAKDLCRKSIGIDCDVRWLKIAVKRLKQEVLQL